MACRRCGQIVRKALFGFCMLCSMMAPHGVDDDYSPTYSVQRVLGTGVVVGGSSASNIVVTPDPARLTLSSLPPTVIVSTASTSSSR